MAQKSFAVKSVRRDAIAFNPNDLVIVDEPGHPLFDDDRPPPDEGMIRNIDVLGVQQPIVVQRGEDDRPLVVCGRRRVLAAREVNRRREERGERPILVPAVLQRGGDGKMFSIMISENEIRADNDPMSKAKKAQRMLDFGANEDQIALAFGVSNSTIRNWLGLLDVAKPVQRAVEAKTIAPTAAYRLAKLPKAEQAEALDELIKEGGSKRGGAAKAKAKVAERQAKANGKPQAPRMRSRQQIEERLETKNLEPNYRLALRWVLGLTDAQAKVR